jgi:antitoxin (DNA-binding transcriptional repressor) of toxin-antitoxin stability system
MCQTCQKLPVLTGGQLSGTLSDMKQVNAREFQKTFSKVADELNGGETVAVTKHGKPLGFFTKAPVRTPAKMPDFAGNLARLPMIGPAGGEILADVVDESVP